MVTITCQNNKGIKTFITDLKLYTKGKLTLESDCMAVRSTFMLLSRDMKRMEMFNYFDYNLIIPNLNITPNRVDKDVIENFDNFSKLHSDLLINHVTHQMNDLNMASIRITKLRQLMKEYQPTNFRPSSNNYNADDVYTISVLIIIILLLIV